jgi:hypothetical protein
MMGVTHTHTPQAMQPHKETRELLYRMFKAGFVHMQVGRGGQH